nr:hypothetical protein [Tanacetum cinerariifolium]
MARLLFCDYHNMVAILEKGEHNSDFHPMVDFLEASPLRYALTVKPTVYVSHIRQFWSTARIETTEEGTKILATVDDQDRATIAKSFTLPHDSAPRVTSPVADEGSMQPNITELTVLCTSLHRQHSELLAKFQAQEVKILKLKERVKVLEDRDDAPIKGRSMDEGEEATKRISDDTEEMWFHSHCQSPATDILTGSDVVPTASPVFATATVVTPYSRRKGKEVMVESDTPKKQRLQEQIDAQVAKELEEQQEREDKGMSEQKARDAEVVRIHAEEELQSMIDGLDINNETIAKYLQEYQQFAAELPLERRIELICDLVKDFKGMTFEGVEAKFNSVYKQMEDFIPMGSKEEAERYKRKGIMFDQESLKKLKSLEEVIKEAKSTDEIPEEKIKEMMQLIPIEEVYVEALQVKHPIIDWKVHKEGQRSYWKIIGLGGSSACYQFFVDLLKHLDREDLNQLWILVKEYLSIRPASSDKEMELWVELKRLNEPDPEDQLDCQRQRDLNASREGLSSEEGSSLCNDLLQASSGEFFTDDK